MDSKPYSIVPSFLQFCAFFAILSTCTHGLDRSEYIVYMGHLEEQSGISSSLLQHVSFLQRALKNTSSAKVIDSYKSIINGFLAHLTKDEVQQISSMQEVVSVFPNRISHLHTTRSWDYIQFPTSVKRVKTVESNIIIGVIDSGIWPELDCFNDEGYGPPPPKWKASCQGFTNFTCNNKIIGARYYKSDGIILKNDILSPRDTRGHGTHVASTIAGGLDSSASFYGLANGTARGGVPSSRIAVYKVCWSNGCKAHDIMTAFTDAISDGVDIISISSGLNQYLSYFHNPIAIGSFHAMRVGILTVTTAGNLGSTAGTVTNVAPWGITVAASTTSRKFYTTLKLDDGTTIQGVAISTSDTKISPIVYAGHVPNRELNLRHIESRFCRNNSLDAIAIKRKIVLCDGTNSGETLHLAGAAGMVIQGDGPKDSANVFALPTTYVDSKSGKILLTHINTVYNPTAQLFKSHEIIERSEPSTASFSSRGPNPLTSHILKPDLSAPGVNILAAWTLANHSPDIAEDKGRSAYKIMSGTSMACPHVSAAAAYVKSFNPSWPPAYIKSALMTTAIQMSSKITPDAEFGYGAGLIDPVRAIDPGLVYDASQHDYVQFLCGHGYRAATQLRLVTGVLVTCNSFGIENILNLNLPSFQYRAYPRTPFKVSFHRRVTNVGQETSTYKAIVHAPMTLKIQVDPTTLSFNSIGQNLSYNMVIEGTVGRGNFFNGYLIWACATHNVSSPIVVYA